MGQMVVGVLITDNQTGLGDPAQTGVGPHSERGERVLLDHVHVAELLEQRPGSEETQDGRRIFAILSRAIAFQKSGRWRRALRVSTASAGLPLCW